MHPRPLRNSVPFLFLFALLLVNHADAGFPEEWKRYPILSEASDFLAIERGAGMLVAAGKNGALATSINGDDWTLHDSGTSVNLTALSHGAGMYVAVSGGYRMPDYTPFGTIVTSPNGIDWTAYQVDFAPHGVTFGAGRFVAVSRAGLFVSEDGLSWSKTADGDPEFTPWEDVTYANGRFVAVGAERLATSDDGLSWDLPEAYGHEEGDHLQAVAFGGGEFVAVGPSADERITAQSSDGVEWARVPEPFSTQPAGTTYRDLHHNRMTDQFLSWSENLYFLRSPGSSSTGSWITRDKPIPFNGLLSGEGEILAAGTGSSIWRSHLPSWTAELPLNQEWEQLLDSSGWIEAIRAIGSGNGRTLLVGDQGLIVSTADGILWTVRDSGVSARLKGTAFHAGQWVVTGENGTILTSPDGVVWTGQETLTSQSLNAVVGGDESVVAAGTEGVILVSDDNIEWQQADSGVSEDLHGAAFGHGRFVVVGSSGKILTSDDSINWSRVGTNLSDDLRSITFGNGRFVGVGLAGTVVTSDDGETWSVQDSGHDLHSVTYGNGFFVAVRLEESPDDALREGLVLVSQDGATWEEQPINRQMDAVYAAGFGHGRFLIGGEDGTFLYSPVINATPEQEKMSAAGGTYEIALIGAESWTASSVPSWVSVDPMQGAGDAEIAVTVEENTDLQDRHASMLIAGIRHTLHQSGAGHAISVSAQGNGNVSITPDPQGDRLPTGTMLTLVAEPADSFLGWSEPGVESMENHTVEVVLESDLILTAHFTTTPTHLYGIASHNDRLYAAGSSSRILQSSTTGLWEMVDEGWEIRAWAAIAAGGGRLVAVGEDGGVAISEDGVEWQKVWGVAGVRLWEVVYEDGFFWALGNEGYLARSADGVNWFTRDTGTNANLRGLTFDGSVFVAVGEEGTVLRSTDGVIWTAQTADPSWNIRDVAFGSEGFVAITRGGEVLHSADGVSWTSSSLSENLLSSVAFGNGRYVVSGGSGERLAVYVSQDAGTWIRMEIPLVTTLPRLIFDGDRFLAAGMYGSVLSSIDGIDWEILRTELEHGLWGVDRDSGGHAVAVGQGGHIRLRATDGNWQTVAARSSAWLWDIVSNGNVSVAVGNHGRILRSEDGGPWEIVRNSETMPPRYQDNVPDRAPALRAITYGQEMFVAVGTDGADETAVALTSDDGQAWTSSELPVSEIYWSVAYGSGIFVAVGEAGATARSADGVTWEAIPFDESVSLHSVVFQEETGFSVSGSNNFRAHSADGTDWEVVSWEPVDESEFDPLLVGTIWEAGASGTGLFVALGGDAPVRPQHPDPEEVVSRNPLIEISADGKEWTRLGEIGGDRLNDVVVGSQGATAVGESGRIYEFPLPPLVRNPSADLTLSPGEEAVFSAEAAGTPPFAYAWTRDGEVLPSEEEPGLTITNVERSDLGAYRLEVQNAAGIAQSEPIFLVVLTNYEDWLATHQGDLPDGGASRESDPFDTGIPNLLAYSLDRPPGAGRNDLPKAAVQLVTVDGVAAQYPTLTFTRTIGAEDVQVIPEASGNLIDWQPIPPENTVEIVREEDREIVTVRGNTPLNETAGALFFRVRVTAGE